jgi:hypothetical protein
MKIANMNPTKILNVLCKIENFTTHQYSKYELTRLNYRRPNPENLTKLLFLKL